MELPQSYDIHLRSYLAAWNLSNPQLLTQTATSQIYTVTYHGETVVLKLLSPTETEEQRGALALRFFDGRGAVRLLRSDEHAQLLEYAAGDELATLVERGEDERATRIIAEVIGQLHSAPQNKPPDGLMPLDRWFGALFAKAAADERACSDTISVRSAAIAERLLASQREVRVLHGDIHHYNIRHTPRGWLAFDCANTLCNPVMPELVHNEARLLTNAALLADALALDPWRVLAYEDACLNASWHLCIGGDDIVQWHLKVATGRNPLRRATSPIRRNSIVAS